MVNYYFDTSIWIDLFEDRNEPNRPKADFAKRLINKIIKEDHKIIYSNLIIEELKDFGYTFYEIKELFKRFQGISIKIGYARRQFGKAKDLAKKRKIPLVDALHAIIARDFRAILITRDHHFKELRNIILTKAPEDII